MEARFLITVMNAGIFTLLFRQKKLTKKFFLLLLLLDLLSGGLLVSESLQGGQKQIREISRQEAVVGSQIQLQAETEGKRHDVTITIPAAGVSDGESEKKLEAAAEKLDSLILGRNTGMDRVQYDLNLPTVLEDSGISAEWSTSRPDVLSWNGRIQPDLADEGTDVTITGMLTLGDKSLKVERTVTVFPSKEEGVLEQELQEETDRLNEEDTASDIILPDRLHGKKVNWYKPAEKEGTVLALLVGLIGILLPLSARQKQEDKQKKRQKLLEMEYPDLAGKILLLTGAGLSMRKVFERIGGDYRNQKRMEEEGGRRSAFHRNKPVRRNEACEEVLLCLRDFNNGVPEGEVYRSFGERCNLACYRGLAMLLEQNLNKGGDGMTRLLEAEVGDAYERRRRLAKEEGEKSEIRMALPMIMMLMVVMIVLMVPAMLSF